MRETTKNNHKKKTNTRNSIEFFSSQIYLCIIQAKSNSEKSRRIYWIWKRRRKSSEKNSAKIVCNCYLCIGDIWMMITNCKNTLFTINTLNERFDLIRYKIQIAASNGAQCTWAREICLIIVLWFIFHLVFRCVAVCVVCECIGCCVFPFCNLSSRCAAQRNCTSRNFSAEWKRFDNVYSPCACMADLWMCRFDRTSWMSTDIKPLVNWHRLFAYKYKLYVCTYV